MLYNNWIESFLMTNRIIAKEIFLWWEDLVTSELGFFMVEKNYLGLFSTMKSVTRFTIVLLSKMRKQIPQECTDGYPIHLRNCAVSMDFL